MSKTPVLPASEVAPEPCSYASLALGLERLAEIRPAPPYWCAPDALRYYFRIPELTPSNNELRELHFHEYRRLRERWFMHVRRQLAGTRPSGPLPLSAIAVIRHSAGNLDWDNAFGGLKPLQDCLVAPTKRNPNGLGLVADDNPKAMPYPPFMLQVPGKRAHGFVELFIFEVADV